MSIKNDYNHSDFVVCREIGDFAKYYEIKCRCGLVLGRNKVFKILRVLGILSKKNVPYQHYLKYFRILNREYQQGDNTFIKPIVFIRPESEVVLLNKIKDFAKNTCLCQKTKKTALPVSSNESIKIDSPLDFTYDQALDWCRSFPEFMRAKSVIFQALMDKWQFTAKELNLT